MDTLEIFSIQVQVNSGTIEILINHSFIEKHYMNNYKLSKPILVYNINNTPNKDK